jgi:uncharacterized membrane protein
VPDQTGPATGLPSPRHGGRPPEPLGEDLGRIISLSDGVFAFSLTLLVLSLAVPNVATVTGESSRQLSMALAARLQSDWSAFLGYVFAFVMIAIWWTNHHRIFRYIRRYDSRLVWLNMAVLLEVAVAPFVLSVFNDYSDTQVAVALFAALQVTTGATMGTIWSYATAQHRLVDATIDPRIVEYYRRRSWATPAVFGLSIAVSFASVLGAELCWVLLFVVVRLSDRYGS